MNIEQPLDRWVFAVAPSWLVLLEGVGFILGYEGKEVR